MVVVKVVVVVVVVVQMGGGEGGGGGGSGCADGRARPKQPRPLARPLHHSVWRAAHPKVGDDTQ